MSGLGDLGPREVEMRHFALNRALEHHREDNANPSRNVVLATASAFYEFVKNGTTPTTKESTN